MLKNSCSSFSSNKRCAFTRKCARIVKEQRARFYIMKRCVTMLIFWQLPIEFDPTTQLQKRQIHQEKEIKFPPPYPSTTVASNSDGIMLPILF
ncbi:hypothetical protein CRYUN_Cryun05aG0119600 [Craigia yunnanensis]